MRFVIVITQLQVTMATKFRALTRCMNVSSTSRTSEHAFVFVYRVIFVKIGNILMWICEV
jgi:hypothetical protein